MDSFETPGETREADILLEIHKLKEKFDSIHQQYETQQESLNNFSKSVDELTQTMNRLVAVFDRAEKLMRADKNPQMERISMQSAEIAKGVISVADLIKKLDAKMSMMKQEERRTPAPEPKNSPSPPRFDDPEPFKDDVPEPPSKGFFSKFKK